MESPREGQGVRRFYRVRRGAPYKLLFRVPVVAAGIQLGWALQLSLLTPYVQELGIPHAWASWIWLCGPITGLIVQPIVGHYSDQSLSPYGRRRPFIIAGTLSVTTAVLLIGFSADLGWMLGDKHAKGRMRPWAIGLFIIGFWMLDLANNVIQGPLRALLADMAGRDSRRVRAALAFYSSWAAVGNVMGYGAGSYAGWYQVFPFTLTEGCGIPCANLKSAFLIGIAVLWVTAAVTLLSCIDPWRPTVEIESSRRETDGTAAAAAAAGEGGELTSPLLQKGGMEAGDALPRQPKSAREETGGSANAVGDGQQQGPEKKRSGQVPGLTTTLSQPDLIMRRIEKMDEVHEESGNGSPVPQGKDSTLLKSDGARGLKVETGDTLPISVGAGATASGSSNPGGFGGILGKSEAPRLMIEDVLFVGEDERIEDGDEDEAELLPEEEPRTWLFWELLEALKELPFPVWMVMVVLAFTWMAAFPFYLFDTDWMGRDIFRGQPGADATQPSAQLYFKGVHMGAFGLLLNSVVSGVAALALEPIARKIGSKWVWVGGNLMLSGLLGTTAVVTRIAAKHKVIVDGVVRGPPAFVQYSALSIFAAIGIPFAVMQTVPYSLAATHIQGTGGGQGLTMGVLNLACVIPQMLVSLASGPWDELFGGGNVPAFLAASVLAFTGSMVASFVLRSPAVDKTADDARLRRVVSSPI